MDPEETTYTSWTAWTQRLAESSLFADILNHLSALYALNPSMEKTNKHQITEFKTYDSFIYGE